MPPFFFRLHKAVNVIIQLPDRSVQFIKVLQEDTHHFTLEVRHDTIQVIYDLYFCRFQVMGNHFFLIKEVIFSRINFFAQQDIPGAHAINIPECAGKLNVGAFQHLLETAGLTVSLTGQALTLADKLPELALVPARDIALLEQPMLEETRNPFRIFYICLVPRGRLHMVCIHHNGF